MSSFLIAPFSIVLTTLFLVAQRPFSKTEDPPASEPPPITSRQMALAGASALIGVVALGIPNQWVFLVWSGTRLGASRIRDEERKPSERFRRERFRRPRPSQRCCC